MNVAEIMAAAKKAAAGNLSPAERETFSTELARQFFAAAERSQRRIAEILSGGIVLPKPTEIVKVKYLCRFFARDKSTIIRWKNDGTIPTITLPTGRKAVIGSTIIEMMQNGKLKKGN